MRVLMICCAALWLAACSSAPALPDVTAHVETVTVPKVVTIGCVRYEDIPAPPSPPAIASRADIEQRAAWAVLRDQQLRQYAAQLRAALVACATGGKP